MNQQKKTKEKRNKILLENGFVAYDENNATVFNFYNTNNNAKKAFNNATTLAIDETKKWLNAIFWAAKKEFIRSSHKFVCLNGTNKKDGTPIYSACNFNYFCSQNNSQNFLVALSKGINTAGNNLSREMVNVSETLNEKLPLASALISNKLEEIKNDTNCSFAKNSFKAVKKSVCNKTIHGLALVSLTWVFGAATCVIVSIITFIIWRCLADNENFSKTK